MFDTFFMGGFECADHINRSGARVNLLRETQHDLRVEQDYQLLLQLGIRTVREGLCWSSVEQQPFCYDFGELGARIAAASRLGVQQIWDLCHFGYPDGLYPTHPHFCERFVALCKAFATFYASVSKRPLLVVPINEISFLSWHSGDVRGTVPFAVNCGFDMKYHLCRAVIAGIAALRDVLPDCRILLVEPMIRIHPDEPSTSTDKIWVMNEAQFQAMDIIAGRMCPELGGSETCLDILGFNYYWDCQWLHEGPPLPWPEAPACGAGHTPARTPLQTLLGCAQERYGRPMFIAETGHFGCGRASWLSEVTSQCLQAMASGVDLRGICIYPVIDRPDWDDLSHFHNSGIWDLDATGDRITVPDYLATLRSCIGRMSRCDEIPFQPTASIKKPATVD